MSEPYEKRNQAFRDFRNSSDTHRATWALMSSSERSFAYAAFCAGWEGRKKAVDYALSELAKADAPLIADAAPNVVHAIDLDHLSQFN